MASQLPHKPWSEYPEGYPPHRVNAWRIPAMRRMVLWTTFAMVIVTYSNLTYDHILSPTLISQIRADALWLEALLRLGPFALVMVITLRANRALRRQAQAAAGKLCIKCCYDLSSHPPEGICPECARAYSHDALQAAWGSFAWPPRQPKRRPR